jgi:uncharacterized cupin superfamily protein
MNLFEPTWAVEVDANGAVLRATRLALHVGANRQAANLYELDPGALVSPLHFHHHNEELLFVLTGTPSVRRSDDNIRDLTPGEIVAFPTGPGGVHQILNRSDQPTRVLICATADLPEIAEQTETGNLALITKDGLRRVPRTKPVQAP